MAQLADRNTKRFAESAQLTDRFAESTKIADRNEKTICRSIYKMSELQNDSLTDQHGLQMVLLCVSGFIIDTSTTLYVQGQG